MGSLMPAHDHKVVEVVDQDAPLGALLPTAITSHVASRRGIRAHDSQAGENTKGLNPPATIGPSRSPELRPASWFAREQSDPFAATFGPRDHFGLAARLCGLAAVLWTAAAGWAKEAGPQARGPCYCGYNCVGAGTTRGFDDP